MVYGQKEQNFRIRKGIGQKRSHILCLQVEKERQFYVPILR